MTWNTTSQHIRALSVYGRELSARAAHKSQAAKAAQDSSQFAAAMLGSRETGGTFARGLRPCYESVRDCGEAQVLANFERAWVRYGRGRILSGPEFFDDYLVKTAGRRTGSWRTATTASKSWRLSSPRTAQP
jgi:hypothetical protein